MRINSLAPLICLIASALLARPSSAQNDFESDTASIPWALVAHSDGIVVGTVTKYSLDAQHVEGYVDITVSKVLKGSLPNGPLHTEYGVSGDLGSALKMSQGRPVIAFLMGGADPYLHRQAYQLYEADGVKVLMMDSIESEAAISAEVEREKYQVNTIPAVLNKVSGDTREQVDDAVDKLSSYFKWRRDQGIDDLLKIGCKGVPYIVMRLNSGQPLHGMMHLFEGENDWIWTERNFKQYGPRTVGEALPKVLFQITGIAWQLRDSQQLDDALKQQQYEFWLIYLANHLYQRDPEDFGVWHDDCPGLIW